MLNLKQISPVTSIQPDSVLDISGTGRVIITNDITAVMSAYTNAGRITAYGGLGTVGIDYNNTNALQTTLFAIAPAVPHRRTACGTPRSIIPPPRKVFGM